MGRVHDIRSGPAPHPPGLGAIRGEAQLTQADLVASLPLLEPFRIRKPGQSPMVNALVNELQASETLDAMIKQEEKLRSDLQKARNESSSSTAATDDGSSNSNNVNGGGNDNPAKGNSRQSIASVSKNKSSKKSSRNKSNANSERVKDIESKIETTAKVILQCRQNLAQFTGWTKSMLHTEYSKIAVTLDPESQRYADLEAAITFLFPRRADRAEVGEDGSEDYFHEQRLAYVRETLPVMKRVGRKNAASSLLALPYVKDFQCGDEAADGDGAGAGIVASLIDEMHQLAITEGLRVRLEKQTGDPAKSKVLRHAEDALDQREAATTELVRKHYRKRSIKLHPDRNGEHMRPVFEEFTDARTVLADVKLRQSYLRGMLDVFKHAALQDRLDVAVPQAHGAWVQKHLPGKAEDDLRKDDEIAGDGRVLKLEGGLHHQIPRGIMMHRRKDGTKNENVFSVSVQALRPVHEFYARVRCLRVVFRSADDGTRVVEMTREEIVGQLQGKIDSQGGAGFNPTLSNEIELEDVRLKPGNWEVLWCATLDTVSTDPLNPKNATKDESVTTKDSAISTFCVVDHIQQRLSQDFREAESACKIIRGELSNTLRKLVQVGSTSMSALDRFGLYHQVLVRARKRCSNLHRLLELTGQSSDVHDSLRSLLAEGREVFAKMEERVMAQQKRKDKKEEMRHFKAYIASVLESDDPSSWMKSVTVAQLQNEGGNVNRLYQLFFEGKGKMVLLVDSEVFREAALRCDLFSSKQLKDLAKKGEEVAEVEAIEEAEAAAAEVRRKQEEEEREIAQQEATKREIWAMVGQNAKIHGLTSEKGKTLNHQTARILYYDVDKERFEVQIYLSEDKAYLKKENLLLYYGTLPTSHQSTAPSPTPVSPEVKEGVWNCEACTFENDDASTVCSMCTNPKDVKVGAPVSKINEAKKEPCSAPLTSTSNRHEPLSRIVPRTSSSVTASTRPAPTSKNNQHESLLRVVSKTRAECVMHLSPTAVGWVIGKGGSVIKDMMEESGAKIWIDQQSMRAKEPRTVYVRGDKSSVDHATRLIKELVAKLRPAPPQPIQAHGGPVRNPPVAVSNPPIAVKMLQPSQVGVPPVASPQENGQSFSEHLKVEPSISIPSTSPAGVSIASKSFEKDDPGTQYSLSTDPKSTVPTRTPETTIEDEQNEPEMYVEATNTLAESSFPAPLPQGPGLADATFTGAAAVPPELPTEIGVGDASISSINDRSNTSKTQSNFTLNEHDPLLAFLRSNSSCIKGSVDEFYIWLVKSEDIDNMEALKEAVEDDDYLNDSLKAGNGTSGLKGFKRKTFLRATQEYEVVKMDETQSQSQHQQSQTPRSDRSSAYDGMNGSAFLPSNLFSGNDEPNLNSLSEPPQELICPIGLVLMAIDPVLAADGVTYERAFIENWFRKNLSDLKVARENHPRSERDQRVIDNGIRSPAYGTPITNLTLTPNTSVRNMARAYKEKQASM